MLFKHCISLSNQGGFVDDDNDAIVTENDEDLEENEDEASSRELVAWFLLSYIATILWILRLFKDYKHLCSSSVLVPNSKINYGTTKLSETVHYNEWHM